MKKIKYNKITTEPLVESKNYIEHKTYKTMFGKSDYKREGN